MQVESMSAELHQLLEPYINAPVECDGFTRLAHTALVHAGIEHACMCGRLVSVDDTTESPIHFWIELADGRLIDYRARMWLGENPTVPNGVFNANEFAGWKYLGEQIDLPTLSPVLVEILLWAPAIQCEQ